MVPTALGLASEAALHGAGRSRPRKRGNAPWVATLPNFGRERKGEHSTHPATDWSTYYYQDPQNVLGDP
jgi:hypothetical protein